MCGRLGSPRVAWGCLLGAPRQVKENHQPHLSGCLWTKPPSAISLGRGSLGSNPVLLLQGSQGLSSLGLCSQRQLWGGHHGPNITQPGQGGPPTLKAGVLGAQLDGGEKKHMMPNTADMVRVHRFTGMRPCELCGLRWSLIDTSRTPWVYRVPPEINKNEWRGELGECWRGLPFPSPGDLHSSCCCC